MPPKGKKSKANAKKVQATPEVEDEILNGASRPESRPVSPVSSVHSSRPGSPVGLHLDEEEAGKKKSKKKDALYLTDEQQDDIIQWLQDNPIVYNRRLREYRNTEKKHKLWEDKAREMDVDPLRLQTWVDSMRTRFGRLTHTKSGQAAKEHTERETWILEKFSFLSEHFARQTSRHGVSVSIMN